MTEVRKTYGKRFWRKFKKNKSGMIGLLIISVALFVSIFAYVISPDNTPNADLETVEIQAKNPGYKQLFLKESLNRSNPVSWFSKVFMGEESSYKYTPIFSYQTNGDDLFVDKYIDEDTSVSLRYSINRLTKNHPETIKDYFIKKTYWLGTDSFGRDILSRIIIGTRISFAVGIIALLVSLFTGITLGLLAGYYRGRIDAFILWLINVMWSIPTLLLVFAFTVAMGKGLLQIYLAVGLTMWVNVARIVRTQTMTIRKLGYVESAVVMGFGNWQIMIKHILPNIIGPIMVIAASNFASAILIEAGLSFLGVGVQPPQPSWGLMIKENYSFIITNKPLLAIIPGIVMMLLVLVFNLLGNGLRDAFDVKED